MCLIALAIDQHPRYPLVIAANRDEFLDRPAVALDWWRPSPHVAPVLGGRDLRAGGTWMALGAGGRIAMLTNVRDPSRLRATAPSRGNIVPEWLGAGSGADEFWRATVPQGHSPFNLLAGDLAGGAWWWADDRSSRPMPLAPGLYGLSNAALDTPWPKVQALKSALSRALASTSAMSELEGLMFEALADRHTAPDEALPDTGVGLERERSLAPAFIRAPEARYGTRCSTLLIVERHAGATDLRVVERQFDDEGQVVGQRGIRLCEWPPQPGRLPPVQTEPFSVT